MPNSKQLSLSFLTLCLPHKCVYFVFHMLQQTSAMLITFQYTQSVAQVNIRHIISREPAEPGL